jgi:phosphoglucosamine mutase
MERVPQVLKAVKVASKPPLDSLKGVSALIAHIESELGDSGRILVRYSGTEKKCRVMLEGDDFERIESYANDVVRALEQEIGHE